MNSLLIAGTLLLDSSGLPAVDVPDYAAGADRDARDVAEALGELSGGDLLFLAAAFVHDRVGRARAEALRPARPPEPATTRLADGVPLEAVEAMRAIDAAHPDPRARRREFHYLYTPDIRIDRWHYEVLEYAARPDGTARLKGEVRPHATSLRGGWLMVWVSTVEDWRRTAEGEWVLRQIGRKSDAPFSYTID